MTGPMLADTPAQKDRIFLILTGVWLFTALFLFGNPVILDYLHPPKFVILGEENRSNARPYLGILAVLGLACVLGFSRLAKPRFRLPAGVPKWLAWLPAAWLGWQLLSFLQTENQAMSLATVIHFASCLAAFYLGLFVLGRMRLAKLALWGAALGLLLNLADACVEKFGGLEQTRDSIIAEIESGKLDPEKVSAKARESTGAIPPEIEKEIAALPPETAAKVRQLPLELVKRMYSTRLYGHMFYPNALAGVILLLLPVSLALLLGQARWGRLRFTLALGLAVVGLACLYWSGSKAGWLIAIVLLGAWFLHWPLSNKLKLGLAGAAMVLGLAGFAVKYADYFDRGATSVGARFGYWRAAAQTAMEEPLLGTGPGTFQLAYKRHRAPDAEPTRLTHNDYLQQASDSGWPGFALYAAFVGWTAWVLARRRMDDPVRMAARLGLLAWVLQGFVEFGLYIPASAWPAWLMLGWLLAEPPNRFDKSAATE
ncbi:MAG: O-antigen ligase family protein [Verrucomicrobiota bacterium]|nr:O-antigen ligase family protein [Verrucomicrobiota bacterium]